MLHNYFRNLIFFSFPKRATGTAVFFFGNSSSLTSEKNSDVLISTRDLNISSELTGIEIVLGSLTLSSSAALLDIKLSNNAELDDAELDDNKLVDAELDDNKLVDAELDDSKLVDAELDVDKPIIFIVRAYRSR